MPAITDIPVSNEFGPVNHMMGAHIELPSSEFAQIDAIADLLTSSPVETAEQLHHLQPITDSEAVRDRALKIKQDLDLEAASFEERVRLLDVNDPAIQSKIDTVLAGNTETMHEVGVDFRYIQFDKVIAALLSGKPPVEIETVGPYLAAHLNKDTGQVDIKMENLPPDEAIGIQMAAVIRRMAEGIGRVKVVSLLDEFNNYVSERGFTETEQDTYIAAMGDFFRQAGVILPDDKPGEDFVLLRESDQIKKFGSLKTNLGQSGNGEVITDEDGDTYFKPTEEFIAQLGLKSKNRRRELRENGILLCHSDGIPTCQAMDASSYLNPRNKELLHVVMLDQSMEAQQDKTYTLLRAMGIVGPDTYHNTFFDSQGLPPELVVYAIIKTMQTHVGRLLDSLLPSAPPIS
jgi:hypothetical protein